MLRGRAEIAEAGMNDARNAPSSRKARTATIVFLAAALVAVAVPSVLGLEEPIAPILWLVGGICLVLAVVHRWRRPRAFLELLLGSLVGFILFAVLHNLCYGVAEYFKEVAIVRGFFELLHVGFFLIAVMLCPAGAIVGALGALVSWIRSWKPD
jgi:hypothetical protein